MGDGCCGDKGHGPWMIHRFAFAVLSAASIVPATGARNALQDDCARAAATVREHRPAASAARAAWVLRGCGAAGAQALATAFAAHRHDADSAALEGISSAARGLRYPGLLSIAVDGSLDGSAAPAARVFAVRQMMWWLYPSLRIPYARLADDSGRGTCRFETESDQDGSPPAPPTAADRRRIRQTVERLGRDRTLNPRLRYAVSCAMRLQADAGVLASTPLVAQQKAPPKTEWPIER